MEIYRVQNYTHKMRQMNKMKELNIFKMKIPSHGLKRPKMRRNEEKRRREKNQNAHKNINAS